MANTPIKFIDDSPEKALSDAIADYQSISGRVLGNADGEMLLINAFAYRMALHRADVNWVGNQNTIDNATGPALDQLGMKSGTFRLDESNAVVTIEFTMAALAPTCTIPQGTRVKSGDGAVIFATNEITNVPSGTATVDVDCTCLTAGVIGNGYAPGFINAIVDPVAYVDSASNTDTSTGGSDQETDDQLRARIPLANATFSVAGPEDAYTFFAKTASPSIVDVRIIVGPVAGGIATSALGAGGAGYAANDTFTINTGTTLAKGKVLTVAAGAVLTYAITAKGAGYSVAAGVATTATSGGGAGLTINISTLVSLMTVTIYPLLADGVIPGQPLLDEVEAICSDKKVRPLSDTVVAKAPTNIDYTLGVQLTVKKSANATAVAAQVLANLQGFVNQWNYALGVDLRVNQFRSKCMIDGVYDVAIPSFVADVAIAENEFGNCTSLTVAVINVIDEP